MNKIYNLLLAMISTALFSFWANGQNLVPNPSFEQYDTCPNNLTQISNSIGWSSYKITPDYFNSCAPTGGFSPSVPENVFGFQYAKTGNAYAGLATFFLGIPNNNKHECIGIQLLHPLSIGKKYYASFFVSRASSAIGSANIASNKLGMLLSTINYSEANPIPILNHAHIYTDSIISDTLNWTPITGYFVADSAYNYLSIGNFFDDSLTSFTKYDTTSTTAYYYIDDISLTLDSENGVILLKSNDEMKIYPNPTHDFLFVEGRDVQVNKISICDERGNIQFLKGSVANSRLKLDLSGFNKGNYLIQILNSDSKIVQKIIIN